MNGGVRERLEAAGLVLPPIPSPKGGYVPATRAGGLVFTSGQLPLQGGLLSTSGLVGSEVTEDAARTAARAAALNVLAAAASVCDLDDVDAVVKLVGYVASAPGFSRQSSVIDAASEVLLSALGEAGRHAREAVGVAALPLGAPVEVSAILSLRRLGQA